MTDFLSRDLETLDACLAEAAPEQPTRVPAEPAARRSRVVHWYETRARLVTFVAQNPRADAEGSLTGPRAVYTAGVEGLLALECGTKAEALEHLVAALTAASRMLDERGKPSLRRERANALARLTQDIGELAGGLGLLEGDPTQVLAEEQDRLLAARGLDRASIEERVAARQAARTARDWERSDALAAELAELGVVLMDRAGETSWKLAGDA